MAIVHGVPLDGLVLQPLQPSRDSRGSFVEIFKRHWPLGIDASQWSVVSSIANVMRGPHFHLGHDEYFMLIKGTAFVGLRDIRPGSPTRDRSCLIRLHESEPTAVSFRRGTVHGWYFPEESLHIQSVTACYEEYHPADNLGCRWDDPELDIPWPCSNPILSERAQAFPSLSVLIESVSAGAAR